MTFLLSTTLCVSPRKKFLVKKAAMKGTKPVRDWMPSIRRTKGLKESKLTQDQRGQVHDIHSIVVRLDDTSPDFWWTCSSSSD